jgi:predicted AlkP superfamily pyrophosphatase or phosphodiesterase
MTSALRFGIACALVSILALSSAAASREDGYVAVISVDGLGANELFSGPSCVPPNGTLRALAARGAVSRGVTSVLPSITYPAHATMVTGVNPERHGVIDNGIRGDWFKQRADIAGETLWEAARKAGKTVAIVTWPSTYGASADYLVPEDLANHSVATEEIRKGATPGLFDALAAATGAPRLLPFSDAEAGTPLDAMTAQFAAEIVKRHKPRLLLAHFLDYDHRMHARPHSPDACAALTRIDAHIARIRDAYRAAEILDRATFFVVSDHGFLEVKKVVNAFGLLKEAGWDEIARGRDLEKSFSPKVAGGSVAFYAQADAGTDWGKRLRELRARIESRHRDLVTWVTPQKARSLGGFPGALFTLCARPGYSVAFLPSSPGVLSEPMKYRGAHGYCPEEPAMSAVFIASGHCVRAVGPIARMAMADVGPTIARFLTASLPRAQGRDRSGPFRGC